MVFARTGQVLLTALLATMAIPFAAHAQTKPSLVVEPGKYSYKVELPSGWSASAEEAQRMKVPLMLFPKGRSFTQSGSMVFINEFCKTPCASVNEPISLIIAHAGTRDPDNKVERPASIKTMDGAPIEFRVITSTINKRQVRDAFAFIGSRGVVVIARLSVGDVGDWDRDFRDFSSALASLQFFDCKAPTPERSAGLCGPEPVIEIDPASFAGRASVADQLAATPQGNAYRADMYRFLGARHSKTMRDCFVSTTDPWTANFEFVAYVLPSGILTELVVQPETNIASCFTSGLVSYTFPKPPKLEEGDGYPIHMEIRLKP